MPRRLPVTTFLFIVALFFDTISFGQLTDPLPDIPTGTVDVTARLFASGLPVAQEFVTPVFTQRVGPTDLAEIPNGTGNLAVTTYGGQVFLLSPSGVPNAIPFLDLVSPDSPSFSENFEIGDAHGLTAIAFHPGFSDRASPGYAKFYTLESETESSGEPDFFRSVRMTGRNHDGVLFEYTLGSPNDARCDTTCFASKRELIRVLQPGWHHNLGDLAFDDNEYLYVSSGDGSTSSTSPPIMSDNAGLLTNVFGKILRIDPFGDDSANGHYGIPATNPFADGAGENVDEIYAYGLRNPYRITMDRVTGDLYASETGELQIESIERIDMGKHHGWNLKEGSFLYDKLTREVSVDVGGTLALEHDLTEPIFEYDHGDGRAVVGGVLYRGSNIPELYGSYVFGDFDGKLFYGAPATGREAKFTFPPTSDALPYQIHSINEDLAGNVYVLGIRRRGDEFDGVVVRINPDDNCDFDADFECNLNDLDAMYHAADISQGTVVIPGLNQQFDMDLDGVVDTADLDQWLVTAAAFNGFASAFVRGDTNLDGRVDATDLNNVGLNWQAVGATTWRGGDFNDDNHVNAGDLNNLALNWLYRDSSLPSAANVPEPNTALLLCLALFFLQRVESREVHQSDLADRPIE